MKLKIPVGLNPEVIVTYMKIETAVMKKERTTYNTFNDLLLFLQTKHLKVIEDFVSQ